MTRLFRVFVPVGLLTLLVVETLLIAGSFVLAAYLFVESDVDLFLLDEGGLLRLAIAAATLLITMHMQDLYSLERNRRSRILLLQDLSLALGATFILQGFVSYVDPGLRVPVRMLAAGGVTAVAAIVVWRFYYGAVVWRLAVRRVVFLGAGAVIDHAASYLKERPYLGIEIIGYVDDGQSPLPAGKVLCPLAGLDNIVRTLRPDLIVASLERRSKDLTVMTLFDLRFAGFRVEEDFRFFEQVSDRVSASQLTPARLVFHEPPGNRAYNLRGGLDWAISAIAGVLAAPLILLAALAVKATSRGPVLERQPRIGMGGRVFALYRLRCTAGRDRRLTPVGRFLRAGRLDGLPVLLNVLRGDMALVGPRPAKPEFAAALSQQIPFYSQRHAVKPGITGWAQIRSECPEDLQDAVRELEYDLYYVLYRSLSLDNLILFSALKAMLVRPLIPQSTSS